MRALTGTLRARLSGEAGFTMIVTILVLFVVAALSAGALVAATGDIHQGGRSNTEKRAYAAAQAGLAWYQGQLAADPNYWSKCTQVPQLIDNGQTISAPVENPGQSPTPWRSVAGTNEQYVVDLLPIPGQAACDPNNPAGTMIDTTTGTFRIRITGRDTSDPSVHRSIVATFRRRGFLDFIYYTSVENEDPNLWAQSYVSNLNTSLNVRSWDTDPVAWIKANCSLQWQNGRSTATFTSGYTKNDGSRGSYGPSALCNNAAIQFASADVVAGPMHTQDSILVCGNGSGPTFGRAGQSPPDSEEIEAPSSVAVRAASGCSTNVNWQGTKTFGAAALSLPPSNGSLIDDVTPGYKFTGTTTIVLGSPSASQMTVTNASMGLSGAVFNQPANGVIYVANGTCGVVYDPTNPYPNTPGCGDVYVKGSYSQNLTITAEKDIIVNGNVTNNGDYILGLIANNYVRVYHANCSAPAPNPITIDAAILTVNGSFLVDNWTCQTLGTLTVNGAIAQKFRGIVGQGSSGYVKNYVYDNRLRYRSPPDFLDPVQAAWKIVRVVEQSPAS